MLNVAIKAARLALVAVPDDLQTQFLLGTLPCGFGVRPVDRGFRAVECGAADLTDARCPPVTGDDTGVDRSERIVETDIGQIPEPCPVQAFTVSDLDLPCRHHRVDYRSQLFPVQSTASARNASRASST